jgi:hypothetical protein
MFLTPLGTAKTLLENGPNGIIHFIGKMQNSHTCYMKETPLSQSVFRALYELPLPDA